jgi:S-DNA-T family DNA segregation ATPase FtsK/SpoIIIE
MARPQKKSRAKKQAGMRSELKQDLFAIALFATGVFVAFCFWKAPAQGGQNLLGALGYRVYDLSQRLFGQGKWFLALALICLGGSQWLKAVAPGQALYIAYGVVTLAGCAIAHLRLPAAEQLLSAGLRGEGGGIAGGALVQASNLLIGITGSWIFYVALIIASFLVIAGKTVREVMREAGGKARNIAQSAQNGLTVLASRKEEDGRNREKSILDSLSQPIGGEGKNGKKAGGARAGSGAGADAGTGAGAGVGIGAGAGTGVDSDAQAAAMLARRGITFHLYDDGREDEAGPPEKGAKQEKPSHTPQAGAGAPGVSGLSGGHGGEKPGSGGKTGAKGQKAEEEFKPQATAPAGGSEKLRELHRIYRLPGLNLLQTSPKVKSQRLNKDITDNVRILEETLASFGVKAVVTQVNRGPSITRFELQPAAGVKVSKIVNLSDDLALALAAAHIRIEAPIPGKAAIGIEVPNAERALVCLREILEDQAFLQSKSRLTFALGRDIAGAPIVADLAKMPHLLIAGTTGSGKSVCMNALIASILFSAAPDEVKMMMVDLKMVELTPYNGIPHLIHPVVTDAKKAAKALRWAVHEMERRYDTFAKAGVKDIARYNDWLAEQKDEDKPSHMPQFVILIDELADLMLVAPADVEDAICRLAQMARAAGMHLVVATQRPSVDVLTGVIKANIPCRIAFAVKSQTDSRVILDMAGAEKLLGQGDMLYYTLDKPKPVRVQGVYVSDEEIESLTEYIKAANEQPEYREDIVSGEEESREKEKDELDSLLPEAARIFIESGQASISLLQRRLRVGYTRAARLIDQMEEQGIVGGYEGSKARTIRMTMAQYDERFGKKEDKE